MSLKTIKTQLDNLTKKPDSDTPAIVVCWCTDDKKCPYHEAHPDTPPPQHVRTIGGVNLEDI